MKNGITKDEYTNFLNHLFMQEFVDWDYKEVKTKPTFFICGASTKTDKNGLPDKVSICPAQGVDWFVMYERMK